MSMQPAPFVPGTIAIVATAYDYQREVTNALLDLLLHYGLIEQGDGTFIYVISGEHEPGCIEQFLAAFDLRKDASIPLCDACWKRAENGEDIFPIASREDETTYLTALRRYRYELEGQAELLGSAIRAHGTPPPGVRDDHYTTLADKLRGAYETLETFNAQIDDLQQAINPPQEESTV